MPRSASAQLRQKNAKPREAGDVRDQQQPLVWSMGMGMPVQCLVRATCPSGGPELSQPHEIWKAHEVAEGVRQHHTQQVAGAKLHERCDGAEKCRVSQLGHHAQGRLQGREASAQQLVAVVQVREAEGQRRSTDGGPQTSPMRCEYGQDARSKHPLLSDGCDHKGSE